MHNVEELKARGDELAQRIAELEMLQNQQSETGTTVGEDAGANEAQVIPQQKLHAFDVVCDGRETDPWLIYLPSGCISYAGFDPQVVDPAPDATTHLADLQSDTKNGGIYAHLYLEVDEDSDSDSSSEPEVTGFPLLSIDTTPTQQPSEEGIKVVNIKIATIKDGAVAQNVIGSLMLQARSGSCTVIVGDKTGSEFLKTDGKTIYIQGYPEDPSLSHSGIEFWTVSGRTGTGGEKIPPKIIARIKDKPENESWASHSLTVTPPEGSPKTVHFLGNEDIDIEIPSAPEPPDPLEGSDYIDVDTAVSAKVATPANQQVANTPNALLTHNTDQFVRSKKTFLGLGSDDNALKKVVIDGPNGKIEVQNAAGNRIIKLDAANIPNECGQGGAATIQVRKLTVTHPREKDGKSAEIYHVISCADIDINEGDAIDKVESGTSTQSGEYTITPVTITLKDGTVLPAFNIKAKNGADGEDGDDGASVTGATSGTPVVSENTTTTPITFTLSDGSTVGPVNVVSTNGVEASGSDYINVSSTGVVSAKIPTDGTTGLVTTDTAQNITADKRFKSTNEYGSGNGKGIYFIDKNGVNYGLLIPRNNGLILSAHNPNGNLWNQLTLNFDDQNRRRVTRSAIDFDQTETSSTEVPTMGWVNDKFLRIANLVAGSNITITPDATNPKRLTISATGGATLNHSFSWEGTKKADIAASADIAINSKTIQGSGGITVTEENRVITISGSASQVSGYTTPTGTFDYEVTGQEWDSTNHRIVIHKVKKTYENGLLKTREAVTDEYIQFVEETV